MKRSKTLTRERTKINDIEATTQERIRRGMGLGIVSILVTGCYSYSHYLCRTIMSLSASLGFSPFPLGLSHLSQAIPLATMGGLVAGPLVRGGK